MTVPAFEQKVEELYEFLSDDDKQQLTELADSDSRVVDPLARLFDPEFTATTWPYEYSHTDPEIPGSLHPKQTTALHVDAKHKWLFWGNQVGKTTSGAVELVAACLGRHPVYNKLWQPPLTCWASALSWELWEKILLPELLTWIPRDRLVKAPTPHQHSSNREILIRADNGRISRITGKAAEQGADKYQSARVHLVWLDEEHPEAVWDEMQPRLLRHGGRTIATVTPLKGLTWLFRRVYEPWKLGKTPRTTTFCSHAGLADNPSIKPTEIAALTEELKYNPSQLEARLYGHFTKPQGLALNLPEEARLELTDRDIERLVERGQPVAGIDFGAWRFAFVLGVPDESGRMVILDEIYSQRETLDVRAQKIHDLLTMRKVKPGNFWIWGDCANPQDIMEINAAFARIQLGPDGFCCFRDGDAEGFTVKNGKVVKVGSPYRVTAVMAENKLIKVGVTRIENLISRGAFVVRRGIGSLQVWMLGMNSARAGTPVEGSRLLWEFDNWQYPKTDDAKVQKDVPDDATADGADMMAATRYMVMSWWKAAPAEVKAIEYAEDAKGGGKAFYDARERERQSDRYVPLGHSEDERDESPSWHVPRFGVNE
ncbi:MAG: terminase family protein [Gemmatimonadota bacterium]|nr:terminase family protein [Gemmatimonadota bacterium]